MDVVLHGIFFISSIVFIYIVDSHPIEPVVFPYLRIVPILCLITMVLKQYFKQKDNSLLSMMAGLLFCFFADLILIENDFYDYLVYSMTLFIAGHLFYIKTFSRDIYWAGWKIVPIFLLTIGAMMMMIIVMPGISYYYLTPLFCLILVLLLMGYATVLGGRHHIVAIIGSMIFMISDGMYTFESFAYSFRYFPAAILATYYLAQYCLVISKIKYQSVRA